MRTRSQVGRPGEFAAAASSIPARVAALDWPAIAAEVVPLGQGEAVIFPVHHRAMPGTRGTYRVNMRHGVSRLRSGHRSTLGIIFYDAR